MLLLVRNIYLIPILPNLQGDFNSGTKEIRKYRYMGCRETRVAGISSVG